MAKCKLCGAEIRWIKTVAGKSMPCDPQPVAYKYRLGAKERIVTPNGEVLPCVTVGPEEKKDGLGYVPHWATCKGGIHR